MSQPRPLSATRNRRPLRPAMWIATLVMVLMHGPLAAAVFQVTSATDSGPGSLRAAIELANATAGNHVIEFAPSTDGQPIVLASPLPPLLGNGSTLTFQGNGAAQTIIDGGGQHRPLSMQWQVLTVQLRDLAIRNGFTADGEGGAIHMIGGTPASLVISGCEFINNKSRWDGGAIRTTGIDLRISDSVFVGNGPALPGSPAMGAAIAMGEGSLQLGNSTITGNHGYSTVVLYGAIQAQLANVTLVGNSAVTAALYLGEGATLVMSNSLIGGNTGNNDLQHDGGTLEVGQWFNNVVSKPGNSGLLDGVNGNRIHPGPLLTSPLGNHGGPTRTIALLPGSPALDAGIVIAAGGPNLATPALDQRGLARVGAVDVGAFESRGFNLAVSQGDGQSTAVGTAFAQQLVVEVEALFPDEPVAGGTVTFEGPSSGPGAHMVPPTPDIGSDGLATTLAYANVTTGGPYTVNASANGGNTVGFQLTNLTEVCGAFAFPYTLSGSDNAARVAELRQAIICANGNGLADEIDLDGQTVSFSDGPYTSGAGMNALPVVTAGLVLRNGSLHGDGSSSFRLLQIDAQAETRLEDLTLRGGNVSGDGGGLRVAGPTCVLRNVVFQDNHASNRGGAIFSTSQMLVIGGARFSGNRAPDGAVISHDNAVIAMNMRVEGHDDGISRSLFQGTQLLALVNTLIAGNQLGAADSRLFDYTYRPELRGVTIADNRMTGLMAHSPDAGATGHNIIIWGNEYAGLGHMGVQYAILQDAPTGIDHVSGLPPGFVDPPHDYRLADGSPAIDAGNRGYTWYDMLDLNNNGVLDETTPDLDLNPRMVDDANVEDSGEGPAPEIDLGAYERQTDSGPPGITVTGSSGLETSESGGTATFSIVLERYPSAPVTLALASSDTGEGVVAPATLVFTQADWNRPHVVTVMGVPDGVIDGDQTFEIMFSPSTSADPAYDGITLAGVTVTNVDIDTAAPPLSLGGTVIGLSGSGLVLDLNEGDELLPITADGSFVFTTPLSTGDDYAVSVHTQPSLPAQSCVVINGKGTLAGLPVGNVVVNCGAAVTHAIGGNVSGLTATGLTLQLNGGPTRVVTANGSYAFAERLADGVSYVVSIAQQPTGEWCVLANATGTVAGGDVDDVDVACTTAQAQLQLQIDDGYDYTRYGQVRDYLVTVSNSGNAVASGVQVVGGFSAAFDVAHVSWSCLPGSGSPCSGGVNGQADVPVGGSVTWIVSAPVLVGSNESQATFTVTAGALADTDTNTLVILRDGFNRPYGDGASDAGQPQPLAADEIVVMDWQAGEADGIDTLGRFTANGATVAVQRLHWQDIWLVRLIATDARGQERSTPLAVVDAGASLGLARVGDAHDTGIEWLLEGATQPLSLSLADNAEDTGR